MSNLEDLVPPLELCKQIPDGDFEDSALVWEVKDIGETALVMRAGTLPPHLRFGRFKTFLYPAPTLAELIAVIPCACMDNCLQGKKTFTITAAYTRNGIDYYGATDKNPATAALKLYLAIIPSTPSIPSEELSE